jgi:hypothetical protein
MTLHNIYFRFCSKGKNIHVQTMTAHKNTHTTINKCCPTYTPTPPISSRKQSYPCGARASCADAQHDTSVIPYRLKMVVLFPGSMHRSRYEASGKTSPPNAKILKELSADSRLSHMLVGSIRLNKDGVI